MKMPSKGTPITVDGYGTGLFVGASDLDDPENASVFMKFEGGSLDEGYGNGIIEISYQYYKENRIHNGDKGNISTEKREEKLSEK